MSQTGTYGELDRQPAIVLVVGAHPDDCDMGAGAAVARWVDAGATAAYCVVTDGGTGAADPGTEAARLPQVREREQWAAARTLGVSDVRFLGRRDGSVVCDQELRRDLSRVLRQVRPDRVVCHAPDRGYREIGWDHPDHLAVGEAVLSAVYPDARNPFAHPELLAEGLEPHHVREVWLYGGPVFNAAVDVGATLERKVAAMACHATQFPDPEGLGRWVREVAEHTGAEHGLGAAEAFRAFRTG